MKRLIRLSFLVVLLGILSYGYAQSNQVYVSGSIEPGQVRVFMKDSVYIFNKDYTVNGTLLIEPGTTLYMHPNGRLIVAAGGRVLADGLAKASYIERPGGLNPVLTYEPLGHASYEYFFYNAVDQYNDNSGAARTIRVETPKDPTVHLDKYNHIFHVLLNKSTRQIVDIVDPSSSDYPRFRNAAAQSNSNLIVLSYEQALMYQASRLNFDPENYDPNLKTMPWRRVGGKVATINPETIKFIGQAFDMSREWGHIIVLPGARAAFFRNVEFESFKKDTTVDRVPLYPGGATSALNKRMKQLTNGAGGAITTFSSRTWLIDCKFSNNMARLRGGALNILSAPIELASTFGGSTQGVGYYPATKNPHITNPDGTPSIINTQNPILRIDNVDESMAMSEPWGSNNATYRQAFDDARLAIFLGRMRNLEFHNNMVQLANVRVEMQDGRQITRDVTDEPANYPMQAGNEAYGGAIYISGMPEFKDRQIEVSLGFNNSINIGGEVVFFDNPDTFIARNNESRNFQQSMNSHGARGGALYLANYTSMIVAGEYTDNRTYAKYFEDDSLFGVTSAGYSMGGAIFMENTLGRLQVRGGPSRENVNETYFTGNKSAAGGAIFIDGNTSAHASPVVGGSDAKLETRDYGFDIKFEGNSALTHGGAILTKRNMTVNGSGGVEANALLGYDGKYSVRFWNNTAGFSGGAIDIRIPNAIPPVPPIKRAISLIRAEFIGNVVGEGMVEDNITQIRGGGAIYSFNGELNVIKGVDFLNNTVYNGNGGAVSLVNLQDAATKRYFLTDLDEIYYENGLPVGYTSHDDAFTGEDQTFPADVRMLTRFIDNEIILDQENEIVQAQMGTGTTQVGQGTPVTTLDLLATKWVTNTTGYAVGMNGVAIKFTNSGDDWQYLNTGVPFRFTTVAFTSEMVGYFGGDRGIIVKTIDGGATFQMLNTNTDLRINDIFFVGSNVGYAVADDGYILRTVNAGATWSVTKPGILDLKSVFFVSTNVGFAVGNNAEVLRTTDGINWEFIDLAGTYQDLNSVHFVNSNKGFILGQNGTFLVTENAGNTWNLVDFGIMNHLKDITFIGQTNGFMIGTGGLAWKSVDGGDTWTPMTTDTELNYHGLSFPTPNVGYIVGDAGLVLRTMDAGANWAKANPTNMSFTDVNRYNLDSYLPENGIGLGGALYILDSVSPSKIGRIDSVNFNRVRIQDNMAYSGSAIYSDNYDLKLILTRSLVTGNNAYSMVGMEQNVITGALSRDNGGDINFNEASSDLAGATIYGEVQGPLPAYTYSEAANSIYNNNARFLIRLPDAPNSKGILAGTTGLGYGGTDTLRGNFWGATEANVHFTLPHMQQNPQFARMETFFVSGDGNTWLQFLYPELINPTPADPRQKGPFESISRGDVIYVPVVLKNADGTQNIHDAMSIPEKLLMSGHVYDLYDKNTDIKTADYSNRRMSPIEDFSVGIPPKLRTFDNVNQPSYGKVIKRWTRDPFIAEARDDDNNLKYPGIAALITEFKPDVDGVNYHPIGYPLHLEARANYDDLTRRSNHDPRLLNHTVYFVINLNTGDFIRANLEQVSEDAPHRETFRATIEMIPDSSERRDPTWRRSAEGLANLGSGPELLKRLYLDPYDEDFGVLQGRRYTAQTHRLLGRVPDLFSNRPGMPPSNLINGESRTTYFGGERYRSLPVRVGDSVQIVSRTILWREGVHEAALKGTAFRIVESTVPPVFTGDIVKLQTDTIFKTLPSYDDPDVKEEVIITEFLNKVFVTEDRPYPVEFRYYSGLDLDGDPSGMIAGGRGRDSILNITSVDTNRFWDPRYFEDPANYSQLGYRLELEPNSGLSHWLVVNRKSATDPVKDGAYGYLELAGRPINPFVVPGGEWVRVYSENYPPHYRTLDSLLAYLPALDPDVIAQYIETFPSYMHAEMYDIANARYLQQDTINVGSRYTNSYQFHIFVVDSVPRFLEPGDEETIYRMDKPNEVYVDYVPSVYPCGFDRETRLLANLTDKLRFQIDINTDDELEDHSPAAAGWDFRYGRTSYGYISKAIRMNPADTAIFDEIEYDGDPVKWGEGVYLVQSRPEWMDSKYMYLYDGETQPDAFATDFTAFGKINIRIPADEAYAMITPDPQYHGSFHTDTIFTVVVNDGHTGIASKQFKVMINVVPTIVTDSLPPAIEDRDYNPTLLDQTRRIIVTDPNFGQKHTYELIYVDNTETSRPIDPCFEEAGVIDLSNKKTTPLWLKINPNTGVLYGTPRVKDAPRDNILVTVIVTDENGLATYAQIPMVVLGVSHNPFVTGIPSVDCIDPNLPWSTTFTITDTDLLRTNPAETITITLLNKDGQPLQGFTVTPNTYTGNGTTDNFEITITKTGNVQPDADGKVTIQVIIEDAFGNKFEKIFKLHVSLETNFTASIRVENVNGAYQDLIFGTSSVPGTSTGDGNDGEYVGKLDVDLCEYELPPVPFNDVFDSRWEIANRQGVHFNIFPTAISNNNRVYIYKAIFQAGGLAGGTSALYPVKISWDPNEIPALNDAAKNPAGSSWHLRDRFSDGNLFTFNMRDPMQNYYTSSIQFEMIDGRAVVTVIDNAIEGFVIMHDWTNSVTEIDPNATATRIVSVSPNPVSENTTIEFELLNSGNVTIQLVDLIGNELMTLTNDVMKSGTYQINWDGNLTDGNQISSGQYMLRLVSGKVTSVYPIVIVK
ncbi:MAG: hypothetical protein CVV22_07865 [Ignavibacteriae bacterium HGW-Ignavibacteriae-1]|jgi:predicted outer membrane repeat protein|nr:MAG: hypothetical protein CVV22_07865 [Ignavibacteriae bacterium HGW-Ignavibacteriae-1]